MPLPAFALFATDYCEPDGTAEVWWRKGDPSVFSEFTSDRSRGAAGIGNGPMDGGRGSGWCSGQYSFGPASTIETHGRIGKENYEGLIPVPGARNPLRLDNAREFQQANISLMRFAYTASEPFGFPRLAPGRRGPRSARDAQWWGMLGWAKASVSDTANILWSAVRGRHGNFEDVDKAIWMACRIWRYHREVHPMNILLSRWGYDGILPVRASASWACSGDTGSLRFPPIDAVGKVIGLEGLSRTYSRPDCLDSPEAFDRWYNRFGEMTLQKQGPEVLVKPVQPTR